MRHLSLYAVCVCISGILFASLAPARAADKLVRGKAYPLLVCPVSGQDLTEQTRPVEVEHEGRTVLVATEAEAEAFREAPEKYLEAMDRLIAEAQREDYPTTVSLVSGKSLGEDAVEVLYANRLVLLADETEREAFEAEPEKYLALLDAAVVEARKADYPSMECPMGCGPLPEDGAVDYVHGTRLLRFCCPHCAAAYERNPVRMHRMVAPVLEAEGGMAHDKAHDGAMHKAHEGHGGH